MNGHGPVDGDATARTVDDMDVEETGGTGALPPGDGEVADEEAVDPIDALGDLPDVVGPGGHQRVEAPARTRGESSSRLGISTYLLLAAMFAALTIGAALLTGGDGEPAPTPAEDQVAATGGPTDAEAAQLDDSVANPEPAVIEELRWVNGATIEAAVFLDDCTAAHSIDAELDGDTVVVTVTAGAPATAPERCGEPTLRSVRLDADPGWADAELVPGDGEEPRQ